MKITLLRSALNEAVGQVSKAVSPRPPIPILGGIKLEADSSGMSLTASDTDISIRSFIPAVVDDQVAINVERAGSVVLQAKFFAEIVRKLPTEEIHLEVHDRFQTTIVSGATEIQLVGFDPEEFPVLPSVREDRVLSLPGSLLKDMIRQTSFAVSTNESTPILTGVHWQLQDGVLKATATDRHRLACSVARTGADPSVQFSDVVISGRTLNELVKILPDQDTMVDIVVDDSQVLFRLDNVLFFARVLDGAYPDTSRIIPRTFKTEFILPAAAFADAIERAYLLSREEKTNIVRLSTLEDGRIELNSSSSEIGRVTETLQTSGITGEPLRISFNSKYFIDALRVIEAEEIFLGFNGPMSPVVLRPRDSEDNLHLILPYRTSG
ncbi:MAG: DNA polymerase III subunit beta [Paenibacillaceae bacterium ZCTH02-B3]|nr:MAG: DNA polymerase III subunit beta [Paenibacillaceae bacterium ZCTH02-B3]